MTIAILATGDEIIHGDTLNTNSHAFAHLLSSEGLSLGLQLSCSDKEQDIIDSLNFLTQKHNIIILIGGLGPTTDDLTRFALAKFTGEPLIRHQEALDHIKHRLNTQVRLNPGNLQQCLFPKNAILLPNPNGTAVGCYYPWNNNMLFLLPGPPRECLPMFQQQVMPILQQTERSKKQILKWRIFGLAESEIAQTLEDALKPFDCQTGYRLDVPYVEFKVRCTPNLVNDINKVVNPLLAPHLIASIEEKASDKLRTLIEDLNEPITIIDEVTGGLLESLLVKPGIHHLLKFNTLQPTQLFFQARGLTEYWMQQSNTGTTQLTINYSNHKQEGGETHVIPYRSPLVVHYAAEWLSFRLFHLINQLH